MLVSSLKVPKQVNFTSQNGHAPQCFKGKTPLKADSVSFTSKREKGGVLLGLGILGILLGSEIREGLIKQDKMSQEAFELNVKNGITEILSQEKKVEPETILTQLQTSNMSAEEKAKLVKQFNKFYQNNSKYIERFTTDFREARSNVEKREKAMNTLFDDLNLTEQQKKLVKSIVIAEEPKLNDADAVLLVIYAIAYGGGMLSALGGAAKIISDL